MVTVRCATCNMEFCLPEEVHCRRLKDGEIFFCPSGHENVYRPSRNDRLERRVRELEKLVNNLRSERSWLLGLVERLEGDVKYYRGQASGYKGQWVLLRNRMQQEDQITIN